MEPWLRTSVRSRCGIEKVVPVPHLHKKEPNGAIDILVMQTLWDETLPVCTMKLCYVAWRSLQGSQISTVPFLLQKVCTVW
mmetsp:Transcript_5963/g.21039  ORF Transcript_5963/g.21039 Transcript_5963/m.21039 type:complete len:81 (+) Transcript_5963:192-434(+)